MLNAFKYIGIVIALLLGFLFVTAVVSIILAIIFDMQKGPSKYETYSVIAALAAFELLPIFWNIFLISGVVFIVILIFAYQHLKARILNSNLPKSHMDTFIPEDFAQNLEYKLRNIHFASKPEEVNVYSTFDFSPIIAGYKNVIECTLSQLKFLNIRKENDKYFLGADAICALTQYQNNKIRTENEKITLTLSAPVSLEDKSLGSIRCYHCPNCASTINLLNGGVCDYCGTRLDYSKHSWMIEKYENKGKVVNPFTKIKWLLLAIYFGLFVIVGGIALWMNFPTIYQITHYDECAKICATEYNTISQMDEVVPGVSLIDLQNNDMEYIFTYRCDETISPKDATDAYMKYLSGEGFHLYDTGNSSWTLFRLVSYPEVYLDGQFELEIDIDKNTGEISVDYLIDDAPEDDE